MIEKKREEVLAKLSKNCEKTMYDPFVYGDWNKLTMESKKSIESKLNTFKWLYGVNTKEPTDKPVIPVQHIDTMKELLITVIDNTLSTKEKETAESMIKVLEDYVNGLSR